MKANDPTRRKLNACRTLRVRMPVTIINLCRIPIDSTLRISVANKKHNHCACTHIRCQPRGNAMHEKNVINLRVCFLSVLENGLGFSVCVLELANGVAHKYRLFSVSVFGWRYDSHLDLCMRKSGSSKPQSRKCGGLAHTKNSRPHTCAIYHRQHGTL